jgi:PKD repeat protein
LCGFIRVDLRNSRRKKKLYFVCDNYQLHRRRNALPLRHSYIPLILQIIFYMKKHLLSFRALTVIAFFSISSLAFAQAPIANFWVSASTVCSTTSVSFMDSSAYSPTSWNWNFGDGGTSTAQNPSHAYSSAGVYNVTFIATNGSGSDTSVQSITVNALPFVAVNSISICVGSGGNLSASGATTYSWAPPTGLSSTAGSNVTASPTSTTIYTVTGTTSGCSATASSTVTVNPNPTVTVNSPSICNGSSSLITATGAATYGWSPSTGLSAITGSSVTANPTTTTAYTISAASAAGCATTVISTVTVNANPTVTVNSPTICAGVTDTLIASGATTYSWSSGGTANFEMVSPSSNTSYTVTGTSSSGCTTTAISTVTVNSGPPVSVNSATICAGASATLTATGALSYNWSTGSTAASIVVSPGTSTSYTVSGSDSTSACLTVVIATVTVNAPPSVNSTGDNICVGDTATLYVTGAATYSWSSGGTGSTEFVAPSVSTNYTVTGTDANGCTGTGVSVVIVNAPPSVSSTGDNICVGDTATLFVSGANTYSWSSGGTGTTEFVSPSVSTNYTVTGTDANGCTGTGVSVVTVNAPPNVTVNSPSSCAGDYIILTAAGANNYTWSTGDSIATAGVSPTVTSTYTVSGLDANGCSSVAIATVTVNAKPTATIAAAQQITCSVTNVTLDGSGSSSGANISYSWTTSGGSFVSGTTTNMATVDLAGMYILNVSDTTGCLDGDTVVVNMNTALPNASAASNAPVCVGATLNFTGSSTTIGATFFWTGPNSFSSSIANPTISGVDAINSGSYTLSVTDPANGCVATTSTPGTVSANTDIMGMLSYSLGAVSPANVFLITQGTTSALFDTVATATANGSGLFTFSSVNAGNYYLRAEAATSFTMLINTYFGNAYLWDSSVVISHGCVSNTTANIAMVELPTLSGSGTISGVIYEGAGFGNKVIPGFTPYANVIPGVPVKVGKNPGGNIVASGVTDSTGTYTFGNLPADNYTIYTDIPGYPMDSSYHVAISVNDTVANLDYIVDSNSVSMVIDVGFNEVKNEISVFSVFPNPTKGNVNIRFETALAYETITLRDMSGRTVQTIQLPKIEKGDKVQINLTELKLSSGVYLLELNNSGKKFRICYSNE